MAFDFPNGPAINDEFTPPGGPTYMWDGTAWSATIGTITTELPGFVRRQIITASGPVLLDPQTTAYHVEVQGGGAGGGTSGFNTQLSTCGAGGGGGSGGYCSRWIFVPAGTYSPSCVVGASAPSATDGAASSFTDGTETLTANGGLKGPNGVVSSNMWHVNGGLGGSATGGDINVQGTAGAASIEAGGGYHPAGHSQGGQGGSSKFGAGAVSKAAGAAANVGFGGPGNSANGYGAGGGGGIVGAYANTEYGGGVGSQGCIVITEYR